METVAFITTERRDDLIVAFAVRSLDDPVEIESLTLLRTPKYEGLLEDHERGVNMSFERFDNEEDEYLQEVSYAETEHVVRMRSSSRNYELDVRKVDPTELKQMLQVLKKMNFDQRFQMSGI